MKKVFFLLLAWLIVTAAPSAAQDGGPAQPQASAAIAAPMGTAFTYQGRLMDGGKPVNGSYDLEFRLYDAATTDVQVGGPITVTTWITDGLFTVQLDFGLLHPFNGEARYLAVGVRPAGTDSAYTSLSPRQALTPAPYALALPGLRTEPTYIPNLIGGYSGNSVTGGVVGATIGGGGGNSAINWVTDDYSVVGGGQGNQAGDNAGAADDARFATVSGGYGNTAGGLYANIGGGYGNLVTATYGAIAGGHNLIVTGEHAFAGGGEDNTASGQHATVSGGWSNVASGKSAAVGGGESNLADSRGAAIGGGWKNSASNVGATIGGGQENSADGQYATIGGGWANAASGDYATIPGGYGAAATHFGEMAYAVGPFTNAGDAQASLYIMSRQTTSDGSWENLYLDGSSALLTLASSSAVAFDILVVARSDADESAGYRLQGIARNVGGDIMMFIASTQVLGENDAAWDVRVLPDNANDAVSVQVMGNGEAIRWVASVHAVQVSW